METEGVGFEPTVLIVLSFRWLELTLDQLITRFDFVPDVTDQRFLHSITDARFSVVSGSQFVAQNCALLQQHFFGENCLDRSPWYLKISNCVKFVRSLP
jgi:hypothetical protein